MEYYRKPTKKEMLVEVAKTGGAVLAVLGVIGVSALMVYDMMRGDRILKETAVAVGNQLTEKVAVDLLGTDIPLGDDYVVNISHIAIDNNRAVGEPTNYLNVYGVANEEYAFKNSYALSQEQLSHLTQKGDVTKMLNHLSQVLEELQLTKHSFSDYQAMSLGLESEKDFASFTKIMGPAVKSNSFFRPDYSYTPDYFIPMFSKLNVSEKDGKHYVTMDVEGLDVYKRSSPNIAIGIALGSAMGNASNSLALGYAYGVSMAYLTAIEKCDTYARVERFVAEISPEQAQMSEKELREWFVSGIMSKELDYQKENISLSENLRHHVQNRNYVKVVDKEQ